LLWQRNGFYAFESALHVFPACSHPEDLICLSEWNLASCWRSSYNSLADGALFFGEDVFGGQFCLYRDAVCYFHPETGEKRPIANDIEEWAKLVLKKHRSLTGWPLAHDWQLKHGPLPPMRRLVPKVPFVLGGEFSVDNLYALDSVEAMQYYGQLAVQIHDAPDGAQISLRVIE